ncbi:MAG: hypothetical protein GTN46_10700 [Gammaproteobacteria bacterium]|nr:hypothetical protein [Gammaproteobacteria bacterium]
MYAERALDAICCPGRIQRQSIFRAAAIVNFLDFWPDVLEMDPDAIGTETDYIGYSWTTVAAVLA